jgi:hypothetical protein
MSADMTTTDNAMNESRLVPDPRLRIRKRRERGAALILTVIVIMVLTTLAFAMVTFTTTEERTASTFRDSLQARATAEAGVRIVQHMFEDFQDRDYVPRYNSTATTAGAAYDYYMSAEADVETTLNALGIWRSARVGAIPARYTGGNGNMFQPPFSSWANTFGGTYSAGGTDNFDLKFNCVNPADPTVRIADSACWLQTNINNRFVTDTDWNLDVGRITDISFYAPPGDAATGKSYGITTIRVTAEKRTSWPSGQLLARETVIAVIGDATPKPAVFGDGDVNIGDQGTRLLCGDGCQQVHANGNIAVGPISGGEDPMVTSSGGSISGGGTSTEVLTNDLMAPEINPYDLTYKPATTAELNKYYLLTSRRLDAIWRDGNAGNNPGPRACGNLQLSWCQDYNIEFQTDGTAQPARTAVNDATNDLTTRADDPHMYKWNSAANEWTECTLAVSATLSCVGGPTFAVTRFADGAGGADANADLPYNVNRVALTRFEIQTGQDGATVLVDGKLYKQGSFNARMSIIAVGSIHLHSSTTWEPAMSNKSMWISGRDVYFHSNCCASRNTCTADALTAQESGIVAAHEQIMGDSNSSSAGIMLAENAVNYDTLVNSATQAINLPQNDHAYMCGEPTWPWTLPTTPVILSMTTAAD